ncbi:MAG: S-layer homology domain-containing protein [Clostridia bacterium]|nr:S-layer homology domain-containing protein [Clostridia bacterium]
MKRSLCLILVSVILVGAVAAAIPVSAAKSGFSDVADGRWSAASVAYAVKCGYMNGVGNGKFDPSGPLTRAMVATVLWRREGSPAPAAPSGFEDVPEGKWYTDAVAWAKETGIVNGLTDKTFGPNSYITREQLGTMLFRFSSSAPVSVPERADLSSFSDDEKVSGWADEAMKWAVEAGLINGTGGNKLAPDGKATREQFAAIIERYDNSFKLKYNDPVLRSHYTEKDYPLVEGADIYVSTNGDDAAAGTKDAPIRTFARAVEMARALKQTKETSVVVAFFAGDYGDPAVTLTAEDSGTKEAPVIYCAYGDGDVVFSGGAIITEDDFVTLSEEEKNNFSAKAVDKVKKADLGEIYPNYKIDDTLFCDDGVMNVARFPDKYVDGTDKLTKIGKTFDENHIRLSNAIYRNRILKYHTTDGMYLYGYISTGWFKDMILTDGYEKDTKTEDLIFYIPHPEESRYGALRLEEGFAYDYYQAAIVNVTEELDADGEFFVDTATDTLYVYDPHGSYSFTEKERAVFMNRADYVTFLGLTFTSYHDAMICGTFCHGITIDRCTITKCAGNDAVWFTGCDAGRDLDIMVKNCTFSVFGRRVLRLDGASIPKQLFDRRGNVEIYNNHISYSNLTDDGGGAVTVGTNEAHIHHNEFENLSRCAICYSGCNILIEYNSFKRFMFNSEDGGAIYCWNGLYDWGNVIRYNVFYPASWMAVYIDDDEPGANIYGNLFYKSTVVIHDGRNNKINENVLVNDSISVTRANREAVEEAKAAGDLSVLTKHEYYKQWKKTLDTILKNPTLEAGYRENFPEIFDISFDLADADDPSFVLNPYNEIKDNMYIRESIEGLSEETLAGETVSPWCDISGNRFITKAENPIFVNPTLGDYRIREGADFPDIHFEDVGRQ